MCQSHFERLVQVFTLCQVSRVVQSILSLKKISSKIGRIFGNPVVKNSLNAYEVVKSNKISGGSFARGVVTVHAKVGP